MLLLHSRSVWPSEGVIWVPQTVPRSRKVRGGTVRRYTVRWVGSDLSANDGETLLVRELRRDTWLNFSRNHSLDIMFISAPQADHASRPLAHEMEV
jgi:hypothetical protein